VIRICDVEVVGSVDGDTVRRVEPRVDGVVLFLDKGICPR